MNKKSVIALAGNPNVGKSTVFNALTGLRQHTGNWPGKTVACASGSFFVQGQEYILTDLPGTYSLAAHSAEEEIARDFICSQEPDAVIIVCDATCLERSLSLALQIASLTSRGILCVNLLDEARKKGISIDCTLLSRLTGMPVVPCAAARNEGIQELARQAALMCQSPPDSPPGIAAPPDSPSETAALPDMAVPESDEEKAAALIRRAERIAAQTVACQTADYHERDRKIDRILTGRRTGLPLMLLLLTAVLWLTIAGANYPGMLLSRLLFHFQDILLVWADRAGAAPWLRDMLILGVYQTVAWVISVMLPPMAIFFPLFTLLEDLGYLPRAAFNLDHIFKKCSACGKQALTMCMGLGCNAVGVSGCRIIDSPRERLIAILTNSFMPCNGRFPMLAALTAIFLIPAAGAGDSGMGTLAGALILALVICLGILLTFLVSWTLSRTILKGFPTSFTLELPPYRKPQAGRIILRSILDRTLFVLGRAAAAAAPAGLLIWLLANTEAGGMTLLSRITAILDPLGRFMGMDGVILTAFILGFPANEIVIPAALMCYLSAGTLIQIEDYAQLGQIFAANGWTGATAFCVMLFSLCHWPCAASCMTIYRETGKLRWTLLSILIPTLCGFILCSLAHHAAMLL